MDRLRLEFRFASRRLQEFGDFRQVEIDQLSALIADRVIVPVCLSVVPAGAVAKLNLMNESGFFQKAQGVIDRCITDRRQAQKGRLKDLVCSRMIFPFANHLENRLALPRKLLRGFELLNRLSH